MSANLLFSLLPAALFVHVDLDFLKLFAIVSIEKCLPAVLCNGKWSKPLQVEPAYIACGNGTAAMQVSQVNLFELGPTTWLGPGQIHLTALRGTICKNPRGRTMGRQTLQRVIHRFEAYSLDKKESWLKVAGN